MVPSVKALAEVDGVLVNAVEAGSPAARGGLSVDSAANSPYLHRTMAILPILEVPDPRLKTISTPVEKFDDDLKRLVDDMFETMYDAQRWFVGVSVTLQEGKDTSKNVGLYSVQPQKVTTTAGARFFDNTLITSVQWTSIKGNTDIPVNYLPGTSYDLVNVYLTAKPTKDLAFQFSVEKA